MTDGPEPMAYIARAPCGCMKFAGVDVPNNAKVLADEIAACIRAGYTIERVTCAYVREHWVATCDVCKPRAACLAPAGQEVMDL